MKSNKAGIVIRTVYNNQGWAGPCKSPHKDFYKCYKCVDGDVVNINERNPVREDKNRFCEGAVDAAIWPGDKWCWEQTLCSEYFWRNIKGKWRFATTEMPVYFVYTEYDGSLTLWGKATIDEIDNEHEYPTLKFKPFEPLPQDTWIKGLNGERLTDSSWRQGFYRYLDERHENYLSSLVKGKGEVKPVKSPILSSKGYETLNFQFKRDIREKLEKIANNEGREIEDVVREAVAKLIRDRGF